MVERGSLTPISEAEYETIEAAVMETARGRWFLSEFARRNRTADTTILLDAISRLEHAVTSERASPHMDQVRLHLMEMSKAITRTKSEIAAMQSTHHEANRLTTASEGLDAIVRTTERATSDILEAAEHIQETAWTLREGGADQTLCNELDQRATQIYTACSFQDLTAQRTGKIVHALRYLEARIEAMIDIWVSDEERTNVAEPGRKDTDAELSQGDVDTVIINEAFLASPVDDDAASPFAAEPAVLVKDEPEEIGFVDASPSRPAPGLALASEDIDVIDHAVPTPMDASPAGIAAMLELDTLNLDASAQADAPMPEAAATARLAAFAEIETLDTREKLRRFT